MPKRKNTGQVWWLMPVSPTLWEAKVGRLLELRSLRPAWTGNMVELHLYKKNAKLDQAWWPTPVGPATREVEAGGSLKPRRSRAQ